MIVFLSTTDRQRLSCFFETWGRSLASRVRLLRYADVAQLDTLPSATYVFGTLDRLTSSERARAEAIWVRLEDPPGRARLLNHPRRVMQRYELLRTLFDQGINPFGAARATEPLDALRFPVFLRNEHRHNGAISPLLQDRGQLEREIARSLVRRRRVADLLVVEHCDTADADGLYRKYSAFCIEGEVIPRHVIFGRHWVLKYPTLIDESKVAEEREYLHTNPHADQVRAIFDLARIDYGRIDYGVHDGGLATWEINTSPVVMMAPSAYDPMHLPAQEWFAGRIIDCLDRLDSGGPDIAVPAPALRPGGPPAPPRVTARRSWRGVVRSGGARAAGGWILAVADQLAAWGHRPIVALIRRVGRGRSRASGGS